MYPAINPVADTKRHHDWTKSPPAGDRSSNLLPDYSLRDARFIVIIHITFFKRFQHGQRKRATRGRVPKSSISTKVTRDRESSVGWSNFWARPCCRSSEYRRNERVYAVIAWSFWTQSNFPEYSARKSRRAMAPKSHGKLIPVSSAVRLRSCPSHLVSDRR